MDVRVMKRMTELMQADFKKILEDISLLFFFLFYFILNYFLHQAEESVSWDGAEFQDDLSKVPGTHFTYFQMTDSLLVIMCLVLIYKNPPPYF